MLLLVFVALALAGPAWADGTQTGSIGGTVRDVSGGPLPGTQITAKGVKTGFVRSVVSDTNGTYTIRLLPPADYRVEIVLSGFQTVSSVVTVFTDRNTEFDATLKLSAVAETVSVSAELPVVDKTNTTQGANIATSFTQKLAVARQYQSVIQLSPGVTGGANPNVRGALSGNNVFLFDGIDTTDTTTGTFGQNFNYEAMQEIAVNTGGYSAEYGRASGAIVSVVTKSGGNEFHGSAKLLLTNDNWNAQNSGLNEVTGASTKRTIFDELQKTYSGTLGGPVVKDNLWFFGAVEYIPTTTPAQQTALGIEYQQSRKITLWQGKATWQISPSHTFEAAGNGDPFDGILRNDYWGTTVTAERESLTAQKQGGKTFRGTWTGVFSPALSGEATVGTATSRIDVNQFTTNPTLPFYIFNGAKVSTTQASAPHTADDTGYYYNGATFDGFVERPRTQANIALNFYKQLGGHNHNFKLGVDYQYLKSQASYAYPDNAVYYDETFNHVTREFTPIYRDLFDPAQVSTSKGTIWGFYLLDKMDFGRLFLNIGFRVDKQNGTSDIGRTTFDKTVFSPRLSAKFDVTGDGTTLAMANYGRFYQSLIQSYADGFAGVPQQTNYTEEVYDPATGKYVFDSRNEQGGNSSAINTGLKPSYSEDYTVGVEHRLGRVIGVSLKGTYRTWKDLIDDVRTLSGTTRTVDYVNLGEAKRRYRGLEFVVDKRFANSWSAYASYTLSRTEGNHFADFASPLGDYYANTTSTGISGVTINSANKYGLASYDRTHDVKGFGAYTLALGRVTLTPGLTLGWRSGQTYQRQRTASIAGASYTGTNGQFATPRGSDRFPSQFYSNFAFEADFRLFGEVAAGLKLDVFNLTNTQTKISGSATDNANYGKATSSANYAGPRQLQLTVLVTF
ncbi:MAG TPA: TonB-dependent receptor [Thermoanaerobaculia bacterium]|nr:TonB-dependent receptor [Thermoanaerobaculia bacterium]